VGWGERRGQIFYLEDLILLEREALVGSTPVKAECGGINPNR
jgi:hypothetical protein